MNYSSSKCLFILIVLIAALFPHKNALTQIVPDNTLGSESSTINTINELRDAIEGGAIRGDNLFHSFQKFNVGEGLEVYFANPAGVENIFSRVTGGNISEIFGTLGVDGTANLFLMNSNGIVFGQNAAIDVGGSFIATTADSIEFADNTSFSALNLSTEPILTVEIPIGLGFGSNPGDITVNGKGHNLILNTAERTFRLPAFSSLNVTPNNTIALVGGDIIFDGGVVVAEDGHIELGSVAVGKVHFDITNLVDFRYDVSQLKDITFTNLALADASGLFGGSINVVGNNISFQSGSGLFVQNSEQKLGSNSIDVNANSIDILDGAFIPTLLFSERGFVELAFDSQVVKGGILDGVVVPPNQSLDLVLKFFGLSIDEGELVKSFVPSFIFSESLQTGQGKNISISTDELLVSGGSQLITRNFDTAIAGNINVDAGATLEIKGASNTPGFAEQNFEIYSQINSATFGAGTGGNIELNTDNLTTSDGGSINSTSNSIGKGGNIKINASTVDLIGSVPNVFLPSSIAAGASNQGDAGNLIVNVNNIFIRNGAAISTSTLASGNAGQLQINATDSIKITGIDSSSKLPSAITSGGGVLPPEIREAFFLPPFPTGDAGSLSISAKNIQISNSGQINVTNLGTGDAGELSINASEVTLDNAGEISAATALGQGGNIELNTDRLSLLDNSQISATAGGAGNGGNVTIDAETIVGSGNSDIIANALFGNGGNIDIESDVILGIRQSDRLTPQSDITADSELGIDGTININSPETSADDEVVLAPIRQEETPVEIVRNICSEGKFDPDNRLTITPFSSRDTTYRNLDYSDKYAIEVQQILQDGKSKNNMLQTFDLSSSWQPGEPIIEPDAVAIASDGTPMLVATNQPQTIASSRLCHVEKKR